jgi:hypothetical protein
MASDLDTARTLIDAGDHKKALKHLWVVEAQAREDVGSAQSLLELASRLQDATTGGARSESELLVGYAPNHIDRLTRQPDVRRDRVSCTALGGFGWPLAPGLPYELDFDERGVSIYEPAGDAVTAHADYGELLAFELGGPGVQTTGGGFFGGGFGVEGAAEGMLAAGVLNALTTKSKVVTTFSLHTVDCEAFFLHNELAPYELRIRLSEVFVRMRQSAHARTNRPGDSS